MNIFDSAVDSDLSITIIRHHDRAYRVRSDIAADIVGLISSSAFPIVPRFSTKHVSAQASTSSASAALFDFVSFQKTVESKLQTDLESDTYSNDDQDSADPRQRALDCVDSNELFSNRDRVDCVVQN